MRRPSQSACDISAASGLFCSSGRVCRPWQRRPSESASVLDGGMNEHGDLLIEPCSSCDGLRMFEWKRMGASCVGGVVLSVPFLRMAATDL